MRNSIASTMDGEMISTPLTMQKSNHLFKLDWYWLFVESRQEAKIMLIVESEYPCSESFVLITDIQEVLFSCTEGVSPMAVLVGLTVLGRA